MTASGHRGRRAGEKGTIDEPSEQMLSWFEDDELIDCPSCGEKTVIPASVGEGMMFCAECGIVARPTPD